MRQDQYEKLKQLSEKLTDVVLHDADPAHWTGSGKQAKELTQQERGDAYWCRKMATATLSVLMKVYHCAGMLERAAPASPENGDDSTTKNLDAEVRVAEREAAALLKKLQSSANARQH